jgi:hypothetical protein
MGNHPSCSTGCPLALGGFEPLSEITEDFDIYMYNRSGERRLRKQLILRADVRTQMLLNRGYTIDEIIQETIEVMKTKQQRRESSLRLQPKLEKIKSFFTANKDKSLPKPPQTLSITLPPTRRVPLRSQAA